MSGTPPVRPFTLGQIMTATSGVAFVSTAGEIFDLLRYMCGTDNTDPVAPWHAEMVALCAPELRRQHPALPGVPGDLGGPVEHAAWLFAQIEVHGPSLAVRPLPPGTWVRPSRAETTRKIAAIAVRVAGRDTGHLAGTARRNPRFPHHPQRRHPHG